MFSTFPQLSSGSGSEDSESSNESPPVFQEIPKPPADHKMFWDLQRAEDLAVKLLQCERQSPSVAVEQQVAMFDSSVPPPGFVGFTNARSSYLPTPVKPY